MLNQQHPLKQDLSTGNSLAINSIFYTIQGEGPFAGAPSVFVRLAGCNLQCPACDTEYTKSTNMTVGHILLAISAQWPILGKQALIVITGGEPFRQDIRKLVEQLLHVGCQVQIETNGTLHVDLGWAFAHNNLTIVCSPKAGKINRHLMRHIKALKYVLSADSINPADGLPILALDHTASPQVARPSDDYAGLIYVQPIDVQDENENKRHLAAAVASSLKFGYRLCLQVHKLIGVE